MLFEKLNKESNFINFEEVCWGSYDELLKAFRKMREVCEDNPDGIFKID